MTAAADLTNPPLTFIAGPQLLGFFFNWSLYGVLCIQVYMYQMSFPDDPKWRKLFVYGLLALETSQVALVTSDAFHNFVYSWGKPDGFTSFHTAWFSVPVLGGVISCAVQSVFGWHIWVLSGRKCRVTPGLVALLAFTQAAAGIATGAIAEGTPVEEQGRITPVALIWMIGGPIVDIFIAGSMTVLLSRSRGGVPETEVLLNRLIRLVIETGSATALVAVVMAILFIISPKSLLYECPALMLPKMYSNSLLAFFNNRAFIRREPRSIGLRQDRETDPTRTVHIEVFQETVVRQDSGETHPDETSKDEKDEMKFPTRRTSSDSDPALPV